MLEDVQKDIRACRDCWGRFGFEPRPIVSGSARAKVVQISQAPSNNVNQTMRPFDDATGKKLRHDWYQIPDEVFYDENLFYITSIAHCYPGKSPNGGDRLPPKRCADKWLKKEIACVDNKLFVLIGSKAANYFFPKQDFCELVFSVNEIDGIETLVLPHPSPLNQKWLKDHPDFLTTRLPEIRRVLYGVLYS